MLRQTLSRSVRLQCHGRPLSHGVVRVQLDYFMSAQFAGVAVALDRNLYAAAGLRVEILPDVTPGHEPRAVLAAQAETPDALCVGTIEQNSLFPCVAHEGAAVTAVSAMFGRSPLALAALPSSQLTSDALIATRGLGLTVGVHVDSVEVIQHLLPHAKLVVLDRAAKITQLLAGGVHAIQVYDIMEPHALETQIGRPPVVVPLSNCTPAAMELGYSQVIFTPTKELKEGPRVEALRRFLGATYEGWGQAIQSPTDAAKAVMRFQPQSVDHWLNDLPYMARTVERCGDYVKMSRLGSTLGVIEPKVWHAANGWLAGVFGNPQPERRPSLDPTAWNIDPRLMAGDSLAREIVGRTQRKARDARAKLGREPTLAVITVGETALGSAHPDALERLRRFAPSNQSWYDKPAMGRALGVAVDDVHLPAQTTTPQLLAELSKHTDKDGIQLMWPVPSHIDSVAAYSAISPAQDVDGAQFLGRQELAGGQVALQTAPGSGLRNAPVTPAAILQLLDHHGVEVRGKRVVVIGRSRIVGQPLAYLLGARGAAVTILHHDIPLDMVAAISREADVLIACAGQPALVTADFVRAGAVVVNVGTTFDGTALLPDVDQLAAVPQATKVASCPGGVGPLSAAVLFEQVVDAALARASAAGPGATAGERPTGEAELRAWLAGHPDRWTLTPGAGAPSQTLSASYHFPTYALAVRFIGQISVEAERVNHHPRLQVDPQCTKGTTVRLDLWTHATGAVTAHDLHLAEAAEACYRATVAAAERA